jgi:hypothetical protein
MQRHRETTESAPVPSASPRSLRLTMSSASWTGIPVSGHAEQIAAVRQSISGPDHRTAAGTPGLRQLKKSRFFANSLIIVGRGGRGYIESSKRIACAKSRMKGKVIRDPMD